jgi:DNA helicase-2/ATP-dependent DNA helicase PcrA
VTEAGRLLDGLDDQQRTAAEALLGPVCVLAGAGTGKTRAITHRIAYGVATGVYPPGRVLALTFTSRAAGELRSRLRVLGADGVAARTFHAAALAQLNYFWPQVIGGTLPRIVEGKARLLAHAADGLRLRLDTATLRDAAAEIEWRKTSRLTIAEYAGRDRPALPGIGREAMIELQQAYERLKDERRQLDFEDVLLAAAGMLDAEPRVAEQVREQYRFFVVDEYQDVSPLQHDLLRLWLGARTDVCVVGDVSQTIYSFAGASPEYLLGFGAEFPEAAIVRLEENYRSSAPIVHAANRLMRGRPGALELRAHQPTGADGAVPAPAVTVTGYPDDVAEARGIATAIAAEIAAGVPAREIAVLFRTTAQSASIERALDEAGIASAVRGATRFFDRREVVEAVLLLRGATVASGGGPLVRAVGDVLASVGWSDTAPDQPGAVRDRWESLDALMTLAREAPEGTTLRQFVDDLVERQTTQHEPTLEAVTLATIHSAKGLEWEAVHLAGVADGLLPIGYARDEAALEEERRLFYVGITRARSRLTITWASGAGRGRQQSRYLSAIV